MDGEFHVDQGVIAGCSGGTYQNLMRAAEILKGHSIGSAWPSGLSCLSRPASPPILELAQSRLARRPDGSAAPPSAPASAAPASAPATCPPTAAFSIRHSTRNFPNREGSKPGDGQIAYVALMDARSIAATALNRRRA